MVESLDLRICVIHSLFETYTETGVLVGQGFVQILLVVDVLSGLVGPEAERPTGAFHDNVRAQAA